MGDDWQPVHGSLGYEVSRHGQVRRGKRLLKPYATRGGYLLVGVNYPGDVRKRILVHRLVMEAFFGPCPEGMECCHNNGKRDDNRLENLRYDTRHNNMRDQYRHGTRVCGARVASAKLDEERAAEIRKRIAQGEGHRSLAREYGVSHTAIASIAHGKSYATGTPAQVPA